MPSSPLRPEGCRRSSVSPPPARMSRSRSKESSASGTNISRSRRRNSPAPGSAAASRARSSSRGCAGAASSRSRYPSFPRSQPFTGRRSRARFPCMPPPNSGTDVRTSASRASCRNWTPRPATWSAPRCTRRASISTARRSSKWISMSGISRPRTSSCGKPRDVSPAVSMRSRSNSRSTACGRSASRSRGAPRPIFPEGNRSFCSRPSKARWERVRCASRSR